jgi:hypothetical protein
MWKHVGKWTLGKPRRNWGKVVCENGKWIVLAHDDIKLGGGVLAVLNLMGLRL